MRLGPWLIAATLLVVGGTARAESARAVIDRIDLEPTPLGGFRLRAYVSALSLEGQHLDLTEPKSIKLITGTSELKAPMALGRYEAAADADTAIVIVVQATAEFTDVLRVIGEALDQSLLAGLDDRVQIAVLTYGDAVGSGKLGTPKAARSRVGQLAAETGTEPALLDALDRALPLLKKARTEPEGRPVRKMILVIGDGRDRSNDRERVTRLGDRAARENVRIHSFAYSPTDARRPMLLLGELSKRSLGTFRLLRSGRADSWAPALQQMREEIQRQYVLTYFVDTAEVAGRKARITTSGRATLSSNEVKIPEPSCAGETCEPGAYCAANRCVVPRTGGGRGVLGWIVLIVVIAVGALLLLGVIGYLLSRRQAAAPGPDLAPGAVPGTPGAPPAKPNKRSKPPKAPKQPPSAPPGFAPPGFATPSAPPGFAPPSAPPVAPAPVTSGPRLYIMSGPRQGETIGLRHGFGIGAAPDNDLVIADGYASGHHAQIGVDHFGNCVIYDRSSTNGTFLNGVRINERALDHGVTIRIGSIDLRFLAQ